MYLGSYRFDGDPEQLTAAYDRLLEGFPPDAILWHTCVRRDDGLTVYDACPTRDEFARFSTDPQVLGAMAAAGLPAPVVEPLGDVHHVQAATEVLA